MITNFFGKFRIINFYVKITSYFFRCYFIRVQGLFMCFFKDRTFFILFIIFFILKSITFSLVFFAFYSRLLVLFISFSASPPVIKRDHESQCRNFQIKQNVFLNYFLELLFIHVSFTSFYLNKTTHTKFMKST